jgi:transcriptional regulator with XRE-family HTH domain
MPRPEKPVETTHAQLTKLALSLRELRAQSQRPTYRELARRIGYAISVLSEAASGQRMPTWDVVKAYVEACDDDPNDWLPLWSSAAKEVHENKGSTSQPQPDRRESATTSYAHTGALINLPTGTSSTTHSPREPKNHTSPQVAPTRQIWSRHLARLKRGAGAHNEVGRPAEPRQHARRRTCEREVAAPQLEHQSQQAQAHDNEPHRPPARDNPQPP